MVQRTILNDLLYDAAKAYWTWWQQYQVKLLFHQAIKNAEERFRLVKTSCRIGERSAIDTVEALAQRQSFKIRANEILLDLTNSQLSMNVFLWKDSNEPYTVPQGVTPQRTMPTMFENMQLEGLLQQVQLHPELQQYRFKLESLQVEKRLKFQSLLPSVYLKYNQLSRSHNLQKNI